MDRVLIITNNPAVEAAFERHEFSDICMLSSQPDYLEVLLATRSAIHQGKRLLMHPESGSVLPGTTPYRSLLLDNRILRLDMTSLEMIENALARYYRFSAGARLAEWPEKLHQDFQLIDFSLLRQALISGQLEPVLI
ncbi:GrdX family protein [Enterobacter ludwigii]|uniref:GrdX family protein n=1 Tax=Enterobacter ludwigii TaxID=299767 RepID=UPI003976648C